jgi:hypothetical protein
VFLVRELGTDEQQARALLIAVPPLFDEGGAEVGV